MDRSIFRLASAGAKCQDLPHGVFGLVNRLILDN
jgi:hypothetical protein